MDLLALKQLVSQQTVGKVLPFTAAAMDIAGFDLKVHSAFGDGPVQLILEEPLHIDGRLLKGNALLSSDNFSGLPVELRLRVRSGKPQVLLVSPIIRDLLEGFDLGELAEQTIRDSIGGVLPDAPFVWLAFASHSFVLEEIGYTLPLGMSLVWQELDLTNASWQTRRIPVSYQDSHQRAALPVWPDVVLGGARLRNIAIGTRLAQGSRGVPVPILDTVSADLKLKTVDISVAGRFAADRYAALLSACFNGMDLSGISELTALVGAGRITDKLPPGFKQLRGIALKRVDAQVDLVRKELVKAYVRFATERVWNIAPTVQLESFCSEWLPGATLLPEPLQQYHFPVRQSASLAMNLSELRNSIDINKLTTLIVYQTEVPIPIPIFYDKLSYHYVGILGEALRGEIRFPQPTLNLMEIATLFAELLQFATDKDYLLDPNLPLSQSDLKFSIGSSFFLPIRRSHLAAMYRA